MGYPNQPDTKHRLGSITKQFTSMLIMKLVEQGKLKLDVPISTYLPDYPKKNGRNYASSLLAHTSGTPIWRRFRGSLKIQPGSLSVPTELVKLFAAPPAIQAGRKIRIQQFRLPHIGYSWEGNRQNLRAGIAEKNLHAARMTIAARIITDLS